MTDKRGRGRPSAYSPEIAEGICDMLAAGARWQAIQDAFSVSLRSIKRWENERPDFARAVQEAKAAAAELWATLDVLEREQDPQRARVLLEQSRWIASKWSPQSFGDRLALDVDHRVDLTAAVSEAKMRIINGVSTSLDTITEPRRLGGVSSAWPALDEPNLQSPDQEPAPLPDFMK